MSIYYQFIAQILHFYTWIPISIMILMLGTIGLFYQKKFHYKTRYYLFFVAALLTLGEILHLISTEYLYVELIESSGVIIAAILSFRLYRTMMGTTK